MNTTTSKTNATAPSRRALFCSGAILLAGGALAATAGQSMPAAGPDAELIALCDRLLGNEYRYWFLYSGPSMPKGDADEHPTIGPQIAALDEEWRQSEDRVMRMVPTSLEGACAMARLALVYADKDFNYRPSIDNPEVRPLLAVAAWLAQDTALLRDLAAGAERATPVALPGWGGMLPEQCFAARGGAA